MAGTTLAALLHAAEPMTLVVAERAATGLTWVDLVFPVFLVALGAAIPLAHAVRRRSLTQAAGAALRRFAVLVALGVFLTGLTHRGADGDRVGLWLALLGFAALMPLLLALPRDRPALRIAGLAVCTVALAMASDRTPQAFSWARHDFLLITLAWSALVMSLLYEVTVRLGWLRLLIAGALAFLAQQSAMEPDYRIIGTTPDPLLMVLRSPRHLLEFSVINSLLPGHVPPGWLDLGPLYKLGCFAYLLPVAAGTLIGDIGVRFLQTPRSAYRRLVSAGAEGPRAPHPLMGAGVPLIRDVLVSVSLLLTVAGALAGLNGNANIALPGTTRVLVRPYAAALLVGVPLLSAWLVVLSEPGAAGVYLRRLLSHATAWLALGLTLVMLPGGAGGGLEGGARTGWPPTLSGLTVATGLALVLLTAAAPWLDLRSARSPVAWLLGPLTALGRNALLAYAALPLVLAPLLALPLAMAVSIETPQIGALIDAALPGDIWGALLKAALLVLPVTLLTRCGVRWRA